jgi:S-adenosylmethionine hydrolase
LLGVLGSSDRLEIAVRNGSAAELTGARIGDRVQLETV